MVTICEDTERLPARQEDASNARDVMHVIRLFLNSDYFSQLFNNVFSHCPSALSLESGHTGNTG